jgi:drug/metabolite transporter (DMT)-like permease
LNIIGFVLSKQGLADNFSPIAGNSIRMLATAFTGPVLGATLSLFALQHTQVGVASTLIALPPVFLLPVSWLVFREKFEWGAVLGTLVAIGGVALLFLS